MKIQSPFEEKLNALTHAFGAIWFYSFYLIHIKPHGVFLVLLFTDFP